MVRQTTDRQQYVEADNGRIKTILRQTDLCGLMIKDDSVHSTPFPGHRDDSSVQSGPCIVSSQTVGIMLKMEATRLSWWFNVTATKSVSETELLDATRI